VRALLRVLVCAAVLTAAPAARAQLPPLPVPTPVATIVPQPGPTPEPYGFADGGGFHDILPAGTRGRYDLAELAAFKATGATVPHCCDQLPMYAGLKYATPGLKAADIPKYF
jgi:hypothetical protein